MTIRKACNLGVLLLATGLLIGAAPTTGADELVRRGNEAFAREQYKEAAEWYEKAAERGTDPGLFAYNQAVVQYHLGRYRDAELNFSRSLEDARGQRQAKALYGLGNSLVAQAGTADVRLLRDAIHCYQLCRRHPDLPAELEQATRHNLELARLLLVRALAQAKSDDPGNSNDPNKQPKGKDDGQAPSSSGQDNPNPPDSDKGQTQEGDPLDPKNLSNSTIAKRGNPPVVPDQEKLVPMPIEDTVLSLQQAAERIRHESQQARNGKTGPAPGVKDW